MYQYAPFTFSHINLPVQQVSASHNLQFLDMILPVDVKPHILWFLRLLVWCNVCWIIDLWQLLPLICLCHTYAENTYTEDKNIVRYCKNTELDNWANLRDLIAATGLVIWLKLDANGQLFSACVSLKFDGWPRKIMGHLFYITSSFVHHFKSISECKLK